MLICFLLCGFSYSGPETQLIALINKARKEQNIAPISVSWEVTRLARYRAEEMQSLHLFCHESLLHGDPTEMLTRYGIQHNLAGSTIAMGQETACQVAKAWLNSPKHASILLNPQLTHAGVATTKCKENISHWVLLMIS